MGCAALTCCPCTAYAPTAYAPAAYARLQPRLLHSHPLFTLFAFCSVPHPSQDDILQNSNDFRNVTLYLVYLFVAVFILLSMFLAILGEAQANLRDDQRLALKQSEGQSQPEYGVITEFSVLMAKAAEHVPLLGSKLREKREAKEAALLEKKEIKAGPTPVDRIEARQLEMGDKIDDLASDVKRSLEAINRRVERLEGSISGSTKEGNSASYNGRHPNGRRMSHEDPNGERKMSHVEASASGASDAEVLSKLARLEELLLAAPARRGRPRQHGHHASGADQHASGDASRQQHQSVSFAAKTGTEHDDKRSGSYHRSASHSGGANSREHSKDRPPRERESSGERDARSTATTSSHRHRDSGHLDV